jgi:sulfatase maturation enzyme AslB (radical SAM superfamily)
MDKSKTYCVMPHLGMSIQNHGDICVCNVNNLSLKKPNEEVFFIHRDGLKKSWSSQTRTYITNLVDSGVGHQPTEHNSGCSHCYDREKSNLPSQRMVFNEAFSDIEALPTQPRILMIKPGNVCNLGCRMCNPATSSTWYNDGYKLAVKYEGVTDSFAKWTKNFEHIRNGFNADNEEFWNDFDEWLPNLVYIDIYGGEPFLSNRLFESLGKVADSGASANINLQLHTNITIYNEKYLEILSKFKSVSLRLSIDSHEPGHNAYMRYPVDGTLLLENISKFKKYFETHANHVTLAIALSINTMNIYYCGEIYTELSKFDIFTGFNIVTVPEEYDIRTLPLEVKQEILRKNKDVDYGFHNSWKDYILQEIPNADQHFKKFWQITKDLDQLRNQQFELVFPEYYKLLTPYMSNL